MNCPNCGKEIPGGAAACENCGASVEVSKENAVPAERSPFPKELSGGNFGAFVFNWIWAFAHRLWIWGIAIFLTGALYKIFFYFEKRYLGLFFFALDLVLVIYFSIKANELAWNKKHFIDIKKFKRTERIWTICGYVAFLLVFALIIHRLWLPNFIESRAQAGYNSCIQGLSGLKAAEETYISVNKKYVGNASREKLGIYMIPGCKNPDGCGNAVEKRIKRNCKDFEIKLSADGLDYMITGTAMGRTKCRICVTKRGYAPENYSGCYGSKVECP